MLRQNQINYDKLTNINKTIIYENKDLLGKKIAVLVNLAPAKFRGEQSNGMLLAAEGEGVVSLLEPDKDIEDGSEVH